MTVTIVTQRFLLRELQVTDVSDRYLSWFSDAQVRHNISSAQSSVTLDDLCSYVRERAGRSDILFLGIFSEAGRLHIGNIKYEPVDTTCGRAVVGILIGDPNYRGKGVAQEVLRASGQWLRDHRGIRTIELGVNPSNLAAVSAYERVGFQRVDSPDRWSFGADVQWMEWCP